MNKLLILCSALALSACVVPHPYTSTEYQKYKQSDLKVPNHFVYIFDIRLKYKDVVQHI